MLTKDLLRVSRAGGGYRPQFAGDDDRRLAARTLSLYREHVGETRATLDDAVADLEAEVDDFKLVRGFAALLDREASFETRAPIPPTRVRRAVFEAAEPVGVGDTDSRREALAAAGSRLAVDPATVEDALYADRDANQVLATFEPRWDAAALVEQYNLSLAQTALFDAVEVTVRSDDPKALVSAVKRLRLMYEVRRTEEGRVVVVTGPDALFTRTRRYGSAFARLLRTVAAASEWELRATVDDRGTERELRLTDRDVSVPGTDPVAEPTFDSGVEADFAARFGALDLEWDLVREPEPLAAGASVMIPDFAFDWRHGDFRVFFEIMGFWTPEYVEKKLGQLETVEEVELLVAVDESLGVGEEIVARDHRAIPYTGSVRVKDVVDALRVYEDGLNADAGDRVPAEIVLDADVVTLADVAATYGVPEAVVEDRSFPGHERVGRTLVRPAVLASLRDALEPGMALAEAESALADRGVEDTSATLSRLGFRVAWEGLGGGVLREKDS